VNAHGFKDPVRLLHYGDRPSGTSRREDLEKGEYNEIPGSGISAVQDVIMITLA
jgi:hypothetical protein